MRFVQTTLSGLTLVEPERQRDERGFFARTWCRDEFAAQGLSPDLAQCSVSFNTHQGTLRGMHFQAAPHAEAKLVRCTAGAIYDVALDLRPSSATHGQWEAFTLTAENGRMLYIPEGFAHGFQTLEDRTEVFYQISVPYQPGAGRGVRWDDPAFGIHWPLPPQFLSEKDRTYPDYSGEAVGL